MAQVRIVAGLIFGLVLHAICLAAPAPATIRFDAASKVFRLDAAGTTYAFGINGQNELQTIYWGSAIAMDDSLPEAALSTGAATFDPPSSTNPKEYAAWGAGLYVEPDTPVVASGSYWMAHGIDMELRGDFQAAAFRFDATDR
jgi:hypothetical protein